MGPNGQLAICHFGIVVEDVREATGALTACLGLRWGRVEYHSGIRQTRAGPKPYHSVFALSLSWPVYWEVIGRQDSETPWGEVGLNHLAYWCDDVASAAAPRLAEGWTWESGKYYRSSDGIRVEFVPRAEYRPRLERYWQGGSLLSP